MTGWDPAQYARFADHRLRPAIDLLARIPLTAPRRIYDLGCGPGGVARLLAERWPAAELIGVDAAPAMLAEARAALPSARFLEADLAAWRPEKPADLLFSNAALQWLPDPTAAMRRLLGCLAPGGVLAVQMPRNHGAPSHRLIAETVAEHPRRAALEPLLRPYPVAPAAAQHRALGPHCRRLEVWETEYLHRLEGPNPVVEWTKGTALTAILGALGEGERADFLAAYAARIARAYPPEPDGSTLFPFRRLFLIAEA